MNAPDFIIAEGEGFPEPYPDLYAIPCPKCGRAGSPQRVTLGYNLHIEHVELVCWRCDHRYCRFDVVTEANLSRTRLPAKTKGT